ncbi:MAG: EAL domain-containing protein [Beijerinckiaceae bacterium]
MVDRRMGPNGIVHIAAAGGGAIVAGAAIFAAGAPALIIGAAALLGGVSGASISTALRASGARRTVEARFDTLAAEMVLLRQRQAECDAKLADVAQNTVDSPALVWRAATADIQVLGTLVSDLAKTVAEHDEKLSAARGEAPAEPGVAPAQSTALERTERGFVLPQTSPPPASWFEDEAELGFTADPQPSIPAAAPAPAAVSPTVRAELKATLAAALTSDRLELCLQPFVTLPQRKVMGYEASLALKAEGGESQKAEDLRAAADATGMGRELDRVLIERVGQVMRVLRARQRSVAITCPVSVQSFGDAAFRSSVETVVRGDGKLAQDLVLSIPIGEVAELRAGGVEALNSLRRTGISLGVRSGRTAGIDAAALEALGVIEFRLGADAIVGASAGGDIHPADINELLQRRNIRLLVTGVDSEATVRDLLDLDAALAQGEVFGAARPVRPEVLQPRAVSDVGPVASRPATRAPETGGRDIKRQSFRSLLRRA